MAEMQDGAEAPVAPLPLFDMTLLALPVLSGIASTQVWPPVVASTPVVPTVAPGVVDPTAV